MTWPFSCKGCKAKDSEITFLRQILSSMRSIVRDPSQEPERRQALDYEALEGLAGLAKREAVKYEKPQPERFSRNPIQSYDPPAELPRDDDEPAGVPV